MQLRTLDDLLTLDINLAFDGKLSFSLFAIEHVCWLPQQSGSHDCGLYVMKFMQTRRERSIECMDVSKLYIFSQ